MRTSSLRTRSARVTPAAIASAVILVLAALLLWWGIDSLTTGTLLGSDRISQVAETPAADSAALVIAGAAVLLGLILIAAAILPGRKRLTGLAAPGGEQPGARTDTHIALTTSGLAHLAAGIADQVDGVDAVSVAAAPRRVRVRITTPVRDHAGIRAEVAESIEARLAELHLTRSPQVSVSATVKELT